MGVLTKEEAARRLDGSEYRREGSRELWAEMKAAGLVAVFGASDDLCEFRGAVDDEIGCFSGGEARVTSKGLLSNEGPEEDCPYHARERQKATPIAIIWGTAPPDPSWRCETIIPHATFDVMEDCEVYCRGIVFALADVPDPTPDADGRGRS